LGNFAIEKLQLKPVIDTDLYEFAQRQVMAGDIELLAPYGSGKEACQMVQSLSVNHKLRDNRASIR